MARVIQRRRARSQVRIVGQRKRPQRRRHTRQIARSEGAAFAGVGAPIDGFRPPMRRGMSAIARYVSAWDMTPRCC